MNDGSNAMRLDYCPDLGDMSKIQPLGDETYKERNASHGYDICFEGKEVSYFMHRELG